MLECLRNCKLGNSEPLLLSRMIRQSEGPAISEVKNKVEKTHSHKDSALWAPTGWVHVEKDIDFSDPKVRSNRNSNYLEKKQKL